MKYWVTMTDRFFSGWGKAEGLINKFVVECDSYEQAEQIESAANRRSEMSRVSIRTTKPRYSATRYIVSMRHYNDLGAIWKK